MENTILLVVHYTDTWTTIDQVEMRWVCINRAIYFNGHLFCSCWPCTGWPRTLDSLVETTHLMLLYPWLYDAFMVEWRFNQQTKKWPERAYELLWSCKKIEEFIRWWELWRPWDCLFLCFWMLVKKNVEQLCFLTHYDFISNLIIKWIISTPIGGLIVIQHWSPMRAFPASDRGGQLVCQV